jgi:hypothetical protein
MRVVLKTNNPVVLSYATHVLEESGIAAVVFDTHASIMDGSMAMVPRRLMVLDKDFHSAELLLRQAVPEFFDDSVRSAHTRGGSQPSFESR